MRDHDFEAHDEVRARLALVTARSNANLSPSDVELVRQRIAHMIDLRGQMRALSLANADEPSNGPDLPALPRPVQREAAS